MSTGLHSQTVDLAVIRENVRLIRQSLPEGVHLIAVVKADAYGHGLLQVARSAVEAGADLLAVANTEEGVILRRGGITAPVLVLGCTLWADIPEAVSADLTLTVCDPDSVGRIAEEAAKVKKTCDVHLKVDTGMSRIGVRTEEEVRTVLSAIRASEAVRLTGVFTHFSDSDSEDGTAITEQQFQRFRQMTQACPADILRHCANSAAIHRFPGFYLNGVRAGISMYGYPPVAADLPLKPCMSRHACVTFVKEIQKGDAVSYGGTFVADETMRVATVAWGYGDGYHRSASGQACVLIRGRRAPVLGRICMDQMIVDVSGIPAVQSGDRVTLLGQDGDEMIDAAEIADWSGTIPYEVLLSATGRVERIWLHEKDD